MWALKGTFIGISIFGIGATIFMFLAKRSFGASTVDIRTMSNATIYSTWFWAAFVACVLIGLAIARSRPGKFSPVFWVVLSVIDLVPAGALSLILLMVFKLKEIAAAVPK
jgi:hypothetical protein